MAKKAEKAAQTLAQTKLAALKEMVEAREIQGLQFVDENGATFARSAFLIEGQELPMGIVVNDSVYSYIQTIVVNKVKEGNEDKVRAFLNNLNLQFPMLQYTLTGEGQIVLQMSVPSDDEQFNPALMIALVDQVLQHLVEIYPQIMKEVWA